MLTMHLSPRHLFFWFLIFLVKLSSQLSLVIVKAQFSHYKFTKQVDKLLPGSSKVF